MGLVLAFNKGNAQPSFEVGAAITGTVESGQTLTCTYTVVRAKASNVTVRWYSHATPGGTPLQIGTGTTLVLTGTEVGQYIRAIVTATNPAGTVQSTSAYTAAVATSEPPEPPTIATAATITGTADVGETLTVTYDFNNESSVAIQWYSYATEPTGNPLSGTDEVELGTSSTQALTASESGRWIVAVVTATNAVSSAVTSDSVAMAGVDPYEPIPPDEYVPPAYDDSFLTPAYCNAGYDLQAKLNELRPGQKLILQAGATWTGAFTVNPATTRLNVAGGGAIAAGSLTSTGVTATATTSVNHGLATGDFVTIAGAEQSEYNGRFQITVVDDDTFTYTMDGDPADTATTSTALTWDRDWAYIISSNMGSLPAEGTRVAVSDATNMPKIQAGTGYYYSTWRSVSTAVKTGNRLAITYSSSSQYPQKHGSFSLRGANEPEWEGKFVVVSSGSTSATLEVPEEYPDPTGTMEWNFVNHQTEPTLRIREGCNKLRVAGIEVTTLYDVQNTIEYGRIIVGNRPSGVTTWYGSGYDIVIDRCYVHGTAGGNNRDGIVTGSGVGRLAIKDCVLDDWKGLSEAHAIQIRSAQPGVSIINNTIRGCGINVFISDSLPSSGVTITPTPADIVIRGNLIEKKPEWLVGDPSYGGIPYIQKNFTESKGSHRVLIEGNVFHRVVPTEQVGQAFYASNAGGDGVSDVEVRNNLIVDGGYIGAFANDDDGGRGYGCERVRFRNNIYYNMRVSSGYQFRIGGAASGFMRYLEMSRNTVVIQNRTANGVMLFNNPTSNPGRIDGFKFEDNVVQGGLYLIFGNNLAKGEPTIDFHTDNYSIIKNVAVGSAVSGVTYSSLPDFEFLQAGSLASVGFVNTAFTELGHFALDPTSTYYTASTTGGPIGADVSAVIAAVNASDIPTLG